MPLEPFSIPFSHEAVDDLRDRLARTRWADEIPGSGWEYGFDLRFLQEICDYWRERFDWKAQVEKLSNFYFLLVRGSSAATTSNTGPICHKEATSPPPRNLISWPKTFAGFFGGFAKCSNHE
jgi:hypothetical protein